MTCMLSLLSVAFSATMQLSPAAAPRTPLQVLSDTRPGVRWDVNSALRFDFDCDGRSDHAFIGRNEGRVYVGLVRATGQRPEILEFAVSGSIQAAICAEPATLMIESLDFDPTADYGKIDGFRRSRTCVGLELRGGECDSIHLFWNHEKQHLDWWRA
jgi:hypothetical protein